MPTRRPNATKLAKSFDKTNKIKRKKVKTNQPPQVLLDDFHRWYWQETREREDFSDPENRCRSRFCDVPPPIIQPFDPEQDNLISWHHHNVAVVENTYQDWPDRHFFGSANDWIARFLVVLAQKHNVDLESALQNPSKPLIGLPLRQARRYGEPVELKNREAFAEWYWNAARATEDIHQNKCRGRFSDVPPPPLKRFNRKKETIKQWHDKQRAVIEKRFSDPRLAVYSASASDWLDRYVYDYRHKHNLDGDLNPLPARMSISVPSPA